MIAILAITGVPLLTNLLALYQMGIVDPQAADPASTTTGSSS